MLFKLFFFGYFSPSGAHVSPTLLHFGYVVGEIMDCILCVTF
jgi:hypothetical protein